jgi:predicted membrane-bound spermidine synthase
MLETAVFLCGAVVMVIELTGSRIMAPFLGTSLVVWTSLIGIILAAMSAGYWWGGRLADRRPERALLGRIILLAAFATAAIAGTKTVVLGFLQSQMAGLHAAAVWGALLLFAPPALLLGMVAPFAVRLKLSHKSTGGRTAGTLYAVSTIGSIVGTFAAGFVLIAWMGSTNILLLMAAVLALAALLASRSGAGLKGGALAAFLTLLALGTHYDARLAAAGFVDVDTPYNRVIVFNGAENGTGRPVRVMVTGPQGRQSAMYPDRPSELAVPYTRWYRLVEHFAPGMKRLLVLGGGGYSFPKFALANYPAVSVDVVEIDPGITRLARELFELRDHPRLRIVEEDARTFLNRNRRLYDAILCDTFNSDYSIPFHMTTVEAVERIRASLTPNGVALVNVLSAIEGERGRLFQSMLATYRSVFPRVAAFGLEPHAPTEWQNIIIAAFAGPEESGAAEPLPEMKFLLDHRIHPPDPPPEARLTDDYAPVDRYMLSAW